MHSRTVKKAIPKQWQQTASRKKQETMGNLRQKKPGVRFTPPKPDPAAEQLSALQLLLRWWNSLSRKQKAVLIFGVAAIGGLTIAYFATQNSTPAQNHARSTRFKSVTRFFQDVDRALSFPVAAAAPVSPHKTSFNDYSEFHSGTTQHEKSVQKKLERTFQSIDKELYDFLSETTPTSKVISVLEHHSESTQFKLLLFSYVDAFFRGTNTQITVIHEAAASPDYIDNVMTLYNYMKKVTNKPAIDSHLSKNCFKGHHTENMKHRRSALGICTLQAIGLRKFGLSLANSEESAFKKNNHSKLLEITGTADLEAMDNALSDKVTTNLKESNPKDITIVVSGNLHGQEIARVIENAGHPYRMIYLETKTVSITESQGFQQLLSSCIKPLERCSPVAKIQARKENLPYCTDGDYAPRKGCDEDVHHHLKTLDQRHRFLSSPRVKNFPTFFPDRYPTITDFFAPKTSIDKLEAKREQERKSHENAQRREL